MLRLMLLNLRTTTMSYK